jgi:hypothetical protein
MTRKTACFLRLTIAIVCMEACATVAVILTASGAMRSNSTEHAAGKQPARHHASTSGRKSSAHRHVGTKASTVGLRLQKVPTPSTVSKQAKSNKMLSASLLHSVEKARSVLHSGYAQSPPNTSTPVTIGGNGSIEAVASTTAQSALVPASTSTAVPVGTVAPVASTTTSSTAIVVTESPWTRAQTPPPDAVPVIPRVIPVTMGPNLLTGTLAPTQPPVPRWAQGGLSTMHGCECSDSWQLNGLTLRGCVVSANVRMPWCVVKNPDNCTRGYTNSALPITSTAGSQAPGVPVVINGTWDFCTLPEDVDPHLTMASCHCLPLWEHGGVAYSGCNKTDPSGTGNSWCYVAETAGNCAGSRAPDATRLQRWDSCDPAAKEPSFMTKNSCHCKPRWAYNGKTYTSCIQDELVPAPAVLNTTNTSIKKEMLGWCQVFEDERVCPNVELTDEGVLWDTCFFLDEASAAQLAPTLHGCHCLPEWSLDGVLYSGCAWTPLTKASWCPVVEDQATCSNSLSPSDTEYGAGRGRRRWDWCSVTRPKDPSQPWRLSDERFVPKDPAPPAWYQNVYEGLKESYGDWLDHRRQEQASFTGRRRRF